MKTRYSIAALAISAAACGCYFDNTTDVPADTKPETRPQVVAVPGVGADGLVKPLNPADKKPNDLAELQRRTYTQFSQSFSFGGERMPPRGHGLPSRQDNYVLNGAALDFTAAYPASSPWHGYWAIENVHLLGVMHKPEGVVYDIGDSTWQRLPIFQMKPGEKNNLPTRPLNGFEAESLAALRSGGQIMASEQGDRLCVLGAVRAMSNDCMSCHKVESGHLLGAFTYELKRVGKDYTPPKPKENGPVLP